MVHFHGNSVSSPIVLGRIAPPMTQGVRPPQTTTTPDPPMTKGVRALQQSQTHFETSTVAPAIILGRIAPQAAEACPVSEFQDVLLSFLMKALMGQWNNLPRTHLPDDRHEIWSRHEFPPDFPL